MRPDIAAVLEAGEGVATLAGLTATVPVRSVRRAVSSGDLCRVWSQTYVSRAGRGCRHTRRRAVVQATGGILSHVSALAEWGLREDPGDDIHIVISKDRRVRSRPGVVVHRTSRPLRSLVRGGLPVVAVEWALVGSWALLPDDRRREPVISAVRRRLTTPPLLRDAMSLLPSCRGAAELRRVLDLLEVGCHSELEIWGLLHVLDVLGLPPAEHQIAVRAGGRSAYLDAGWPAIKLAVEFDGAASHAAPPNREADIRRDAWLAALGWVVLRFSYRRCMADPEGVRADIVAAYHARCRQLLVTG